MPTSATASCVTLLCLVLSGFSVAGDSCLDEAGHQQLLAKVNTLRDSEGLSALALNKSLQEAAQQHSRYMSEADLLTHSGRNGSKVADRAKAQGYTYSLIAENVAAGQDDVDAVMQSWKSSKGHLKNMLRPKLAHIGVACVADDSDYGSWWTMVLGTPL